ncbi:hypothetical protein [Methylobacterium sp. Leaf89]|uniref:hypothetical protein n=1 Tax=Methylobacterium sp. Leaf89 TaxID=1736245 RepID=UPI000A737D32|nr:hypothetical protein [Methylobacterium sp. Leaf89]
MQIDPRLFGVRQNNPRPQHGHAMKFSPATLRGRTGTASFPPPISGVSWWIGASTERHDGEPKRRHPHR